MSLLLLIGLMAGYSFIARRYRIGEYGISPSNLVTLLPCALIVWAVRLMMEPSDGNYTVLRPQLEATLMMLAWMGVSVIAFFFILAANHKAAQLITSGQEKRLLERECRIQSQNAKEALRRWNDTRAYHHDVRNHLLVVSGLLKQKKYTDATTYLETLVTSADELTPRVSTGNSALNILLEEKIQFAEREGITVTLDLQIQSLGNIDEMDICVLFANGLDNAINACLTAPSEQKRIEITVKKKYDLFIIQIKNSMKEDSSPVVYGTGLHNIRRIALKYGGSMQTEIRGDTFNLSVLLCRLVDG